MSSSRLPGKVLKPLAGKPMIWHIYQRALKCQLVDKVIIATSTEKSDDPLAVLKPRILHGPATNSPSFEEEIIMTAFSYFRVNNKGMIFRCQNEYITLSFGGFFRTFIFNVDPSISTKIAPMYFSINKRNLVIWIIGLLLTFIFC